MDVATSIPETKSLQPPSVSREPSRRNYDAYDGSDDDAGEPLHLTPKFTSAIELFYPNG